MREETAMELDELAPEDLALEDIVLHLPASLRDRAEEMATHECVSLNLFVLTAVAEKLQRLQLQHCLDASGDGSYDVEPACDPWLRVH